MSGVNWIALNAASGRAVIKFPAKVSGPLRVYCRDRHMQRVIKFNTHVHVHVHVVLLPIPGGYRDSWGQLTCTAHAKFPGSSARML